MLELNTQHIDQIRNYFIATSDEEKKSLQNSIAPMFLKGFLNDLKRLYILEPENEIKLISIAKSMGASKHIEALKEIQQQFYNQLAEIYLEGETNRDIELLLKVQNKSFLDEVSFQQEIQHSFIANERELVKKKFNEIDEANDISQSDMEEAFGQIERATLKKKFKDLDTYLTEKTALEDNMVADQSAEYGSKKSNIKRSAKVIKFNWTRFAIAASIIGLLLTTTLIIFKQNKNQEDVAVNKPKIEKPNLDTAALREQNKNRINELLANNTIDSEEKQIPVLKEESFGFSSKEQKIIIRIYNLKNRLTALEGERTKDTSWFFANALNYQIDSLKNLLNKYRFEESMLSIYQISNQEIKVFNIGKLYFIKIGDVVYEVKKSSALLPLKKVTNGEVLKMIDKIIFTNSN